MRTLDVTIRSTSTWTVNEMYAGHYSSGRVFCMGDAVHRHPPTNGLGSNTSIQDAYNLCWKLKLVLEDKASPSLLDSYSAERQPVGKQIVTRANKSIGDFPPIFEAVGLLSSTDPAEARKNIEARKAPTAEGKARRKKLNEAIAHKSYEFNCHGVELNQRYASERGRRRTARRSRSTSATASFIIRRRHGRARICLMSGSSITASASRCSISQARAASRF